MAKVFRIVLRSFNGLLFIDFLELLAKTSVTDSKETDLLRWAHQFELTLTVVFPLPDGNCSPSFCIIGNYFGQQ